MIRLGINLGGIKIEIIALNDDRRELLRHGVDTPQGYYLATLQTIVNLVHKTESKLGKQGHDRDWHAPRDFTRDDDWACFMR